jgi:invasion protein IalB
VPAGCFGEFALTEETIKKLRATSEAGKLSFLDASGHDVNIPLSFKGFAGAFDALAKE